MTFLLIALTLLVGLLIARFLSKRDKTFAEAVDTLQAALTALAIIIAGYWYLVDRKNAPHAELTQTATVLPLDGSDGVVAIEMNLSIKNIGEQLLKVSAVDLRLQSSRLDPRAIERVRGLEPNEWPQKIGPGYYLFHEAELQWKPVRQFSDHVKHEIEPGETDQLTATFLVGCDDSQYKLASEVAKTPGRKWLFFREEPLFWKVRSYVNVHDVCSKEKAHES